MNKGKLIQNGVHLEDHEYKTVKYLLNLGYDVELISPTLAKNVNSADILMGGVTWEMKAPLGGGKNTIRHSIDKAKRQSQNIIFDLRRCKLPEDKAVSELKHHFTLSKRFRRMIIIKKNEEILDFSK